ncbi:hypothetical protein EOL96_00060 [Candidatus Saccharibacteria bacterium]|nr:hypothetical protein [Candidatus Saccharibacteria bacterium]
MKKFWKNKTQTVKDDTEKGARRSVLEDLFNDFNRDSFSVYKFNFFRGVFFGFGSVLGGTVLVALVVWILNATGQLIPGESGFIDAVIEMMQRSDSK